MDTSLTFSNGFALLATMLLLALVPSTSVFIVSARSAAFGFVHGASTALGVVVGDIVYILIAILGLAAIAESMQGLLMVFKYLGGIYLIWLGTRMWTANSKIKQPNNETLTPLNSSFLAGFLLTLADQKAILFYFVFFPAFIDLKTITLLDAAIIMIIATVAVGGAKLFYAFMGDKASHLLHSKIHHLMNIFAATVMVLVGLLLIFKP